MIGYLAAAMRCRDNDWIILFKLECNPILHRRHRRRQAGARVAPIAAGVALRLAPIAVGVALRLAPARV